MNDHSDEEPPTKSQKLKRIKRKFDFDQDGYDSI